jgi:FkbM family methyltransferase
MQILLNQIPSLFQNEWLDEEVSSDFPKGMFMNFKEGLKAGLATLGYGIRKIPPSQCVLQGSDWLADLGRLTKEQRLKTLFDVGANTGQTAVQLARTFPGAAIYSFEPFPDSFASLQKTAKSFPQIQCLNLALGEKREAKKLFVNLNSETNSLLKNSASGMVIDPTLMRPQGSTDIRVDTLDLFCEEHSIRNIDLLKLDTQGYELQVLRGAVMKLARKEIQFIFAEVLFHSLYENQAFFHEVYGWLLSAGYSFLGLYNSSFSTENKLLWADALFTSR